MGRGTLFKISKSRGLTDWFARREIVLLGRRDGRKPLEQESVPTAVQEFTNQIKTPIN